MMTNIFELATKIDLEGGTFDHSSIVQQGIIVIFNLV
jgi:hypothetical protein